MHADDTGSKENSIDESGQATHGPSSSINFTSQGRFPALNSKEIAPTLSLLSEEDAKTVLVDCLHKAIAQQDVVNVILLLQTDVDIEGKDAEGWTPLQRAIHTCSGNKEIIEMILDKKADVEHRDHEGESILQMIKRREMDLSGEVIGMFRERGLLEIVATSADVDKENVEPSSSRPM